ncbi:sialomucin core protein 24 [Euwallacea fornicatus]|uniref:sialomucin core protein 24 n=1 Tax=Euwallacea fornicatus TaxID=995702 RepID=UPI00338EB42F
MQWFAFVLLISFSVCFAQQSAPTGSKTANNNTVPIGNKRLPITDTPITETKNSNKTGNSDNLVINGRTVTDASVTEINEPSPTTQSTSSTTPNSTTVAPTSSTIIPKTTSTPASTTTTVTTLKPVTTINPTAEPVTTTAIPYHDRKFDGPSFVGGIILALGLVAIGFVAFKFYKARTEMNYHTL